MTSAIYYCIENPCIGFAISVQLMAMPLADLKQLKNVRSG